MNASPRNRWLLLGLATATYGLTAGAERLCLPVLFSEIARDLDLSKVQVGVVWGMDPLAGVFVGLAGGLLVDRFGLARILAVVGVLAGLFGALRGLSTSFTGLAFIMFIFGLAVAMTPTVVPKAAAMWFFGKNLALANSVLVAGLTLGAVVSTMTSATFLSPLLGSWRYVLFLYGAPPAALGVVWFFVAKGERDHKACARASVSSFKEALSHVASTKQVWILGVIQMGQMAAFVGLIGYLPLYLRETGLSPLKADGMMAILTGASAVSAVPMGALSDRIGSRKKFLIPICIMMSATLALLPFAEGFSLWGLIAMNGILRGGILPAFMSMFVETEGISGQYAGTAIGIGMTLGMIGSFLSTPVGNGLAYIHPGLPFIFWASLSFAVLAGFFFVREVAWKRIDP
jgi:cyanate permease